VSKELEIIAEALLGAWETPQEVAAHVVSRLSDAGYSIVTHADVADLDAYRADVARYHREFEEGK
jgi:hypothetical protein